jgi:RimJ/RimL family protein N-acetyltransferase
MRIVDLDVHEPTDAQIMSWYGWMTAPDQLRWEYDDSWARAPTTPEQEVAAFWRRRAEQESQNHSFWALAGDAVVGHAGINRFRGPAREHCAEIGYGVAAAFARRGIGTRLVMAAMTKARQLGLSRLEADCFDDNHASIGLLRKCGFREEGRRFGAIRKDGRLRDQRVFGLMLC